MSGGSSRRYPPELRARAARMVAEISDQHESEWAAISEGRPPTWGRLRGDGARPGTTTEESAELKRLRERTPNCEVLMRFEDGVGFLRGRTRPPAQLVTRFIGGGVSSRSAHS